MALYDIATLWVGPSLTWMEQICLKSFVNHGHRTILFCYDPVAGVPDGVEVRDANEILPTDQILRHARTGSPAFHSDIFRLKMIKETDLLWVDTDAYCLKPWRRPDHGYFFGWGSDKQRKPYTGVLGLPQDSQTLNLMLELAQETHPIPPWLGRGQKKELADMQVAGTPVHATEMKWGLYGPDALHYFSWHTGEIDHALPGHVLYPVAFANTRVFGRPGASWRVHRAIQPDTLSVHFYGRRFRNFFAKIDGIPPEGSYAAELCSEHNVDPTETAHLFKLDKRSEERAEDTARPSD